MTIQSRDRVVSPPPASAANFGLCLAALAIGLALIWAIAPGNDFPLRDWLAYEPIIPCLGIVLVIAVAERAFPRLRSPSATGLSDRRLRALDLQRVGVRLCGLALTLALVAFAYWLFPEYRGSFYDPFWRFLRTIAPVAVLVPFYFAWTDTRSLEARDEYQAFGSLLCGGRQPGDFALIRRHLLGWTVKSFFLPLMTVYLSDELRALYGALAIVSPHTMPVYNVCYHVAYAIDLLFCVVGYSTAIRLFDAEIRSTEPTMAGWVAALICYQPFLSVIGRFYLQYDDNLFWDNWLAGIPVLRVVWAASIVALALIYAICTASFGLRFSNLTHRGIITSGPYRFSKHPAYLAKNLSWWMISIPFVSALGPAAALRNSCLLALLNLVYFARARTEERHLSRDPVYVAYALWMNEHGLLRELGRAFPFLRYRPPGEPAAPAEPPAPTERSSLRPTRSRSDCGSEKPRRRTR
ncbi:MAG TPA: isoprenylcysteine carboxylmethyltransferase family protein [Steroidobacteraceae bacterium]|nr:isoprenylcysteine carboxylmethyltransferase family protein [Steroidobacteraceae bacterium]